MRRRLRKHAKLQPKKVIFHQKPDKSVGPVTGGVRLNNLYTKGVISKFRPGKPRSLAFEFNMIVSYTNNFNLYNIANIVSYNLVSRNIIICSIVNTIKRL